MPSRRVAFSPDGKTAGLGQLGPDGASCGTRRPARNAAASRATRRRSSPWPSRRTAGRWPPAVRTGPCGCGTWLPNRSKPSSRATGGAVYCVAFSSDGRTLATGSGDETVKLWDVEAHTERTTLHGHKSGVTAVAFAPGDKTLASAGMDDPVRLWELTPDN